MLDGLLAAPECEPVRQAASAALGRDVAKWWNGLDEQEIFLNANAQFAIAYYQIATWTRIARLLPEISLVAGYSLGELIAYHVAGALAAADAFRDILRASSIAPPRVTVLGSVDATPVRSRDQAIAALSRQIATTIRWDRCMEALAEFGIDAVIELGPGNDLARLVEAEQPQIRARAVNDFGDYRALADWLG